MFKIFMFMFELIFSFYICVKYFFYRNEFYIGDYLWFEVNLFVIRWCWYFVIYLVKVVYLV